MLYLLLFVVQFTLVLHCGKQDRVKMSFWQENYAFIKDVYDSKASKLMEVMDKTDAAIKEVVADKIYTSEEFKKVKEMFAVGSGSS